MANSSVGITAGSGTNIDTFTVPGGDHRQVVLLGDHGGYQGRCGTFLVKGRAAISQNLFAIHNATGSTVAVDVRKMTVDILRTAANAVMTDYVIIRLYKFTAVPTNGASVTKVAVDSGSGQSSSASVTLWQDSTADANTTQPTALAVTLSGSTIVTQEITGRLFTAVGYEPNDRIDFLAGDLEVVTLRALEGLVVAVNGTTGSNSNTTFYTVTCQWEEYTP